MTPLGQVAFEATPGALQLAAADLVDQLPREAALLLSFAQDLEAIRALPEVVRS